jgi:hypothetical protein
MPTIGLSGTNYFGGDIAEVLVYKRVLTTGERAAVQNYLGGRYNEPVFENGDSTSGGSGGPLVITITQPEGAVPLP